MAQRKWRDLSRSQQTAIVIGGAVEMAATTAMLVDLARRPASAVRGSKALWLGLSVVQPVGPLAYFTLGRA